jgi:hypothetical protein
MTCGKVLHSLFSKSTQPRSVARTHQIVERSRAMCGMQQRQRDETAQKLDGLMANAPEKMTGQAN